MFFGALAVPECRDSRVAGREWCWSNRVNRVNPVQFFLFLGVHRRSTLTPAPLPSGEGRFELFPSPWGEGEGMRDGRLRFASEPHPELEAVGFDLPGPVRLEIDVEHEKPHARAHKHLVQ